MKVRVLKSYQPIRQAFGYKLMIKGCYLPQECWPPFEFSVVDIPLTSKEYNDLTKYEKTVHLQPWISSAAQRAAK